MTKTRKGLDRIQRQELQRDATALSEGIDLHVHQCATCTRAGNDVYAKCTDWWLMAKALHRTRRKLRAYDTDETAHLDMLPGMADL